MRWFSRLLDKQAYFTSAKINAKQAANPGKSGQVAQRIWLCSNDFFLCATPRAEVPDFWEPIFNAHPQSIVDEMLELRLLEPVPLLEKVSFCHTGAELKQMLSSRGLKVSGKKAEQAQRLIESDLEGTDRLYRHRKIVRCAPAVSQIVMDWTAEQTRTP